MKKGKAQAANELRREYPYLEREDIRQALQYAAWRAEEVELALDT